MSLQASYRYCWKLAKRTGKNFYYSFLTLPREKHQAMCAIYAWMRLLDDCVDDATGPDAARLALEQWEQKTRDVLAGKADETLLWPAFADTVTRFNIPDAYFFEIIRGAEMDLTVKSYETFDDLYQYCYRVASVVGLACLHVFGFTHPQAKKHGEWLGVAFQLTNILRDVKEDAQRGRIYLPMEDLRAFKINPKEILELQWSEELQDLIESYSRRAEFYYLKARPLFELVLPEARPTLEIMAEIYGGILKRLREIHFEVFTHRAGLTLAEKLMAVARRRFARRRAPERTGEEAEPPDLSQRRVAVIGAGAAGLAAAMTLAEFGLEVSIFEKKMKLGGKAAWFTDPRHREDLENPLHLWLNIHQNTDRFYSMIGVRRFFEPRAAWRVLVKKKVENLGPPSNFAFPFHWMGALRRIGLGWKERRTVIQGMLRLSIHSAEEEERLDRITFLDWLRFNGQGERAIERFWKPFIGILIPDRINRLSTRQVAVLFRKLAAEGPLSWFEPTATAADIYDATCRWQLKSRHVKIRTHENISGIFQADGQWSVVTGDGAAHKFDDVVVTLPRHLFREVLTPKDFGVLTARTQFERLGYAPGILVRLEFHQPLFEDRFTLLNEPPFTWGVSAQVPRVSSVRRAPFTVAFAGNDSRPYVFTQNHDLLGGRVRDIWEEVLGEGSVPAETEYWHDIQRDFASEPGSLGHRPSQETPLPGLWLAGDWTQTEWPAGLEGSLESGFRCAEKILARSGWRVRLTPEPV